jgi:hypothetical protein
MVKSKPKSKSRKRPTPTNAPVADRLDVFIAKTGISRAVAYRLMSAGRLRYVQLSDRVRLIPHSEYVRLGLVAAPDAA